MYKGTNLKFACSQHVVRLLRVNHSPWYVVFKTVRTHSRRETLGMVTSITCGLSNPGTRLSVLCVSLTLPPAGPSSRGDWMDLWTSSDTGKTM